MDHVVTLLGIFDQVKEMLASECRSVLQEMSDLLFGDHDLRTYCAQSRGTRVGQIQSITLAEHISGVGTSGSKHP